MQVIGICRFSYPALGGFQIEHDSPEKRAAFLYSAQRLDERFHLFETLCLPGLVAQTDPDFTFLVLIGTDFPAPYRDRLRAALSGFPQARLVARPPGNHRQVCAEVINSHRTMNQPCLQFRHDDDDAVAVDFVARLRAAALDAPGLIARERYVGIDFNRGFIAEARDGQLLVQDTVTPFWGVALGMAVQAQERLTLMNFARHKLMRFMPTLSYSDSPMYVRSHNQYNDSRMGRTDTSPPLPPVTPQFADQLRRRFALDPDQVARRR